LDADRGVAVRLLGVGGLLESPARSYGKAMHATYHLGRSIGLFGD
jgi:hypothetical protein